MEGEVLFSGRGNNPGGGAGQRERLRGHPVQGDSPGTRSSCPLCRGARGQPLPTKGDKPRLPSEVCGAGGAFPLWRHPGTAWRAAGHWGQGGGPEPITTHPKSSCDHTLHPSRSMVPRWNAAQAGSSSLAQPQAETSLSTGSSPSVSLLSRGLESCSGLTVSSLNRTHPPPPSIFYSWPGMLVIQGEMFQSPLSPPCPCSEGQELSFAAHTAQRLLQQDMDLPTLSN